jgi:uncharacterized protein YhjY with autotransporter beta-barrel domain
MDRFRGFGRCVVGFPLLVALLTPYAACAQTSSGENTDPNDNQASMYQAIRVVCPQLAALLRNPVANPTDDEKQLFVTCNRVLNADGGATSDQVGTATQMLTSEESNAATTSAVNFGTVNRSSIADRLLTLRTASGGTTVASLADPRVFASGQSGGASGDTEASISDGRLGVYVQGLYGSGSKDRTRLENEYDVSASGVLAGMDYRFADNFVGGIAIAYSQNDADFKRDSFGDNIDGSSFDSDGITGSIYGSVYGDRYYADVIGTYGNIDYSSVREIKYTITAKPGNLPGSSPPIPLPTTQNVDAIAKGDTSGDTFGIGVGGGYDFGSGPWRFGPIASFNYFSVKVDGFSEKGAGGLNLLYDDQAARSLQIQQGLDFAYTAGLSWGVVVPYGSIVWVYETKDDQESFKLRYVSDPCARSNTGSNGGFTNCANFNVTSDDPDRSYFLWNVGVSTALAGGLSGFVNYSSVASLSTISYGAVTVGARYQFN